MAAGDSTPGAKLRLALALFDSGVELARQNFRRRDPGASDQEIECRVVAWLRTRPGAEHGDGQGRPRPPSESAA